jgi:uncharacterized protein (TIGR02246 family)
MVFAKRELLVPIGLLTCLGVVAVMERSSRGDQPPTPASTAAAAQKADEAAIHQTAKAFEAAYRAKNADAIAAGFTPNGEVVDIEGNAVRGRAAIADEFRKGFQEHPEGRMTVTIHSVRFVAPDVAIEDGTTTLARTHSEPAIHMRYAAVQVKTDGRWLVASTRDLVPNVDVIPITDRLKPLEFLIGDWVDESEEAVIAGSYRWGEGRKFLTHEFTVKRAGSPVLKGTQRIGWDPLRHTIASWAFDTRGGHSEGTWSWDRNHWLIKMQGVSAAGQASSATAFLTPLSHDAYRWESTDRVVGNEVAPDTTVTVVRKPPEPHEAAGGGQTPPKR